jgi:hypothetical protein
MRRKRHSIADDPATIDQHDIFVAANQPVHRRKRIGNFIATEVFEAERAIFLLSRGDRFVRRALANQGLRNIGPAFQPLKFVGGGDLRQREIDAGQQAGEVVHVFLDLQGAGSHQLNS